MSLMVTMRRRRKYGRWFSALCALCAAVAICGCSSREDRPLNVILISLDTVRPDHLGCYGYDRISTPNIDSLAEESIVFDSAITSVPLTLPSHASLLTGLYPISHGTRINGTFVLADEFTTLAEVLSEQGYSTGAFVGSFVLDSRFGISQGFDTYDDEMSAMPEALSHYKPERTAEAVTKAAADWVKQVEEPFFAFVHYYDPHTPYLPPVAYGMKYPERLYDGEIAFTDAEFGKLMNAVRGMGVLERTLIVLVSDHGEGLGDHGEREHGLLIYDSTMEVAFMIRVPAGHELAEASGMPGRVGQVVELIDVFPTVLDMLGIDVSAEIDGRSVVPLLEGASLPPKLCYLETLYPNLAYKWSPLRGVRFGEWKYILAPEEELYNLTEDSGECRNLRQANETMAEMLKGNLLEIASRDQAGTAAREEPLTGADTEKLKALGYVSPSGGSVPTDLEPRGTDPKTMIVHAQDLLSGGMNAYESGDFESALEKLNTYVELDPGNPMVHLYLAETFMEFGNQARAAAEFHKVIEIDSTNTNALFRLGGMAKAEGDLDRALFFFGVAADIFPETPEILSSIGSILMEQGMTDSAMVVLEQALEIDPHDQIALVNIGLGHLSLEDYDEALLWFHKTLRVNPNHVKALMNIAFIYIKQGGTDSTVAYLERAADVAPNDATILQNLGNAYRQRGMVAEAAEVFEAAVAIEPDNVMALFGLAATKAQQGNRHESVALLERILRLDPNFTPAKQALQTLTSGS
jgi:arylsulfatase A-like enzyme/tetratricopeptide (TPR) repeat protein